MNTLLQNNIDEINQKLVKMSQMVVTAVDDSVGALIDKDFKRAKEIKRNDKIINNIRWEIEEDCINLIATQQPVASDLRELIALLTINTELERIGDYAAGIAKIVGMIGDQKPVKPLVDIPRMRDITTDMVENSMKAYINHNEKSARLIYSQDDDVDELYDQVYRELLSFMIEKPNSISQCTHLLWISHNLERIGDRVTNICERIIYLVSGERAEDL